MILEESSKSFIPWTDVSKDTSKEMLYRATHETSPHPSGLFPSVPIPSLLPPAPAHRMGLSPTSQSLGVCSPGAEIGGAWAGSCPPGRSFLQGDELCHGGLDGHHPAMGMGGWKERKGVHVCPTPAQRLLKEDSESPCYLVW